jgi:membrane dipeptidase
MWSPALASLGAMLAGDTGPQGSTAAAKAAEGAAAALALLRRAISVDVHSHGGKTGISSKAPPSSDLASHMREGSLAVACLADVPDGPILGRDAAGVLSALRTAAPGELYRHHLERLAWIDKLVSNHGVRRALCAADIEAAHKAGEPAIIGDVEGWTFSKANSSGWKKRINAVCGTCNSSTTRPTISATFRPGRSPMTASPNSAPR